jgi:hypothetical protein
LGKAGGMKALTIWQPWCSLIVAGAKPYEFRRWYAPNALVGHRIALHAGARKVRPDELRDLICRLRSAEAWTTALRKEVALPLLEKWLVAPQSLPLGCILGVATLGRPVSARTILGEFGPMIGDSDRIEHSNVAWPFSEIRPSNDLRPVKGAQGFWECDFSEEAA